MSSDSHNCPHICRDMTERCIDCGYEPDAIKHIPTISIPIREWKVESWDAGVLYAGKPEDENYTEAYSDGNHEGLTELAYYSRVAKAVQEAIDEHRKILQAVTGSDVINSGSYDSDCKIEVEHIINLLEAIIKRAKQ